jgi:hypothetical protein
MAPILMRGRKPCTAIRTALDEVDNCVRIVVYEERRLHSVSRPNDFGSRLAISIANRGRVVDMHRVEYFITTSCAIIRIEISRVPVVLENRTEIRSRRIARVPTLVTWQESVNHRRQLFGARAFQRSVPIAWSTGLSGGRVILNRSERRCQRGKRSSMACYIDECLWATGFRTPPPYS